MHEAVSTEGTRTDRVAHVVATLGRFIFALAMVALGVETLVCARYTDHALGPQYDVIPVIPWLPAIP